MSESLPAWLLLRGLQISEQWQPGHIQEITDIRRRIYDDCTTSAHVYTAEELVDRPDDLGEYLQNLGDA